MGPLGWDGGRPAILLLRADSIRMIFAASVSSGVLVNVGEPHEIAIGAFWAENAPTDPLLPRLLV